ncbi:hypothetical protein, partial [Streptomyces subrutilus]|uniref:hypothetical protein n=1 Tax=Streptomyces subrutilus TaxID=36818 RepID=UPI001E2C1863
SQHEAWSTEKLWEVDQEVDTPPRKTYQALMQIRDKIQDTTWTAKCEVSGKYASVEMMGKEGPILREVGWPEAIREAWKGNRGLDWTGWELTDKQGLTDPVIGLVKGTITAQYGVKVRVTLKDITKADDVHEVATYVVNA